MQYYVYYTRNYSSYLVIIWANFRAYFFYGKDIFYPLSSFTKALPLRSTANSHVSSKSYVYGITYLNKWYNQL